MGEGEEEPIDPMPAVIAAVEQMKAGLPIAAHAAKAVYDQFREAGFDDQQAYGFAMAYVQELFL